MQFADEAYDILGFSTEEKYDVYKVGIILTQVSLFVSKIIICPYSIAGCVRKVLSSVIRMSHSSPGSLFCLCCPDILPPRV